MRYAIISDIHANLQAWNAVLTDINQSEVDEILCLGDVVGYGPRPADVLEQVYTHVNHFVLGNHDAVICGKLNPACFNENARALIEWTGERLDSKAAEFFRQLSYVLAGPNFRCAHADPSAPTRFGYILEPEDAQRAWTACPEPLLFVGHSHVPGIFVVGTSGTPHWLSPQNFALEENKRYIINVGSVGQPRNGDVRASYCLYDVEAASINFRQVPFDLDGYRQDLAKNNMPAQTTYFLQVAQNKTPRPLREMLDFHPPQEVDCPAAECSVEQLTGAVRAARRWRLASATMLLAVLALCVGTTLLWQARQPSKIIYESTASIDVDAPPPAVGHQCLAPPEAIGRVSESNRLRDWTVTVAHPQTQQIAAELPPPSKHHKEQRPLFHISSEKTLKFAMDSKPVPAKAGMRFQLTAKVKELCPTAGHLELCLLQQLADGTEQLILHYPVDGLRPNTWKYCRRTTDGAGLRKDGLLRLALRGEFAGDILVRECNLVRKQ